MPVSEARLIANRANALKSRGPVTDEGKARSRENAYKHGMTGDGVVLSTEDAEAIDARCEALMESFRPEAEEDRLLVKRAALLSVRMDRSARQEAKALSARVEGAQAAFLDARMAEAEYLIHHIMSEPRTNSRRLMATPEGVDFLIDAWEVMKIDLEDQSGTKWNYQHALKAEHLNGTDASTLGTSHYLAWTRGLNGNFEELRPDHFAEGMSKDQKQDLALIKLQELVDADLARLREHRATMDTRLHDAQVAYAADIALFDPSKEAILARKYEAAAERGFLRIIRDLKEMRKQARAAEAAAAAKPRASVGSFEPIVPAEPKPPARADFEAVPAPNLATNEVPINIGRSEPRRN